MNEPKLFASLTPSLLARKGGARPAMRPQLGPLHSFQSSSAVRQIDEDLGWNDMGDTEEDAAPEAAPVQAEIVQLHSAIPSSPARPRRQARRRKASRLQTVSLKREKCRPFNSRDCSRRAT